MEKEIKFKLEVFDSDEDLSIEDRELLNEARRETKHSYAPYSHFHVAAAALLVNGQRVKGTNQENASFPAGICAERVLMSTAASLYPDTGIKTMAISYDNKYGSSQKPISPCGICRQSLNEFQNRTGQNIRIILAGLSGPVYIIDNAADLLPLVFSADDMK